MQVTEQMKNVHEEILKILTSFYGTPTADQRDHIASMAGAVIGEAVAPELERLRAELAEAIKVIKTVTDERNDVIVERDALKAAIDAAMVEHGIHVKVFHPDRLLDPRCPWCRVGLVLSRVRPAKPDTVEELQARLAALETPGDETP